MRRILIVDDEEFFLVFLKARFEKEGYIVDTLDDGENLNTYIKENKPDLILLDIFIPGIDGIKLCKALKKAKETKDIIILLFSASTNIEEAVKEALADGFVAKPFDIVDLVTRIQHFIPIT